MREAVDGYRRPTLGTELAGAKVALEAAGIEVRVEGPDGPLDPEAESVLAWAVREGATNAIRHSGAGTRDHRAGPATGARDRRRRARRAAGRPGGNGLTGLRERAQSVGGTVEAGAGPAAASG